MDPVVVSARGATSSVSLAACSSRIAKRKTPSELRLEQRKRPRVTEDESAQDLARKADNHWVSISKPKLGTFSCPPAPTAPCFAFKNVTQLSTVKASVEPVSQGPVDGSRAFPLGGKRIVVPDKHSVPESSLATILRDIPLDLSLKTTVRIVSSDSLHWCHHISTSSQFGGLRYFMDMFNSSDSRTPGRRFFPDVTTDRSSIEAHFWEALHTWVHPLSSLPPRSAPADGQGKQQENSFYVQRTRMWESAFQSLYFMFRRKLCNIFYVCSQQFVVMFIGGVIGGRHKDSCSAYLTRSTRGLRSLLQSKDLQFTMPLSKVEQRAGAEEDLRELQELEKIRPGQTKFVDVMAAIDNNSSSILAFDGWKNVHRLYDFLLNQRSFVPSSANADVPVLLSPVAFEYATLTKPELVCKQMRCAEVQEKAGTQGTQATCKGGDLDVTYTVEIKGLCLPPWIITRMCRVLEVAQPTGFEISFSTDALTEGLNVAQANGDEMDSEAPSCVTGDCSYAQEVGRSSRMGTSSVKHLKFRDNAYTMGLASPVC